MRQRERKALNARSAALTEAIRSASNRLANRPSGYVVELVEPKTEVVQYGEGLGMAPTLSIATVWSWRLGAEPGDLFFELKLLPSEYALALPVIRHKDDLVAEQFALVTPSEVNTAYPAAHVRQIIKLLNGLRPLSDDGRNGEGPIKDFAVPLGEWLAWVRHQPVVGVDGTVLAEVPPVVSTSAPSEGSDT